MVDSHLLPNLDRVPGVQNWIERLPAALRAAFRESWAYRSAKHRVANGLTVGHAIASAIEDCKKGTVGGHPIHDPKALAEQKAALVVWESMKAWNKAHSAKSAAKNTSERKTAAILLATKLEAVGYSREDAARRAMELSERVTLDLAAKYHEDVKASGLSPGICKHWNAQTPDEKKQWVDAVLSHFDGSSKSLVENGKPTKHAMFAKAYGMPPPKNQEDVGAIVALAKVRKRKSNA